MEEEQLLLNGRRRPHLLGLSGWIERFPVSKDTMNELPEEEEQTTTIDDEIETRNNCQRDLRNKTFCRCLSETSNYRMVEKKVMTVKRISFERLRRAAKKS